MDHPHTHTRVLTHGHSLIHTDSPTHTHVLVRNMRIHTRARLLCLCTDMRAHLSHTCTPARTHTCVTRHTRMLVHSHSHVPGHAHSHMWMLTCSRTHEALHGHTLTLAIHMHAHERALAFRLTQALCAGPSLTWRGGRPTGSGYQVPSPTCQASGRGPASYSRPSSAPQRLQVCPHHPDRPWAER